MRIAIIRFIGVKCIAGRDKQPEENVLKLQKSNLSTETPMRFAECYDWNPENIGNAMR